MADVALSTPTFEIITPETTVPGLETAIELTFVDLEGRLTAQAKSARPIGVQLDALGRPALAWLNSTNGVDRMPIDALQGITDLGTNDDPLQPHIAFRYYKQFEGEEKITRVLELTDVAYGTYQGHMGDAERGIAPEKPTWYMVGKQIGTFSVEGVFAEQEPASRVFPFTRIVDGPVGDPTNGAYQAQHGIY